MGSSAFDVLRFLDPSGQGEGTTRTRRSVRLFRFSLGPACFDSTWGMPDRRQGRYQRCMRLDVGEKNPAVVLVPPGVVDAYKCISEDKGFVVNLPDTIRRGTPKAGKWMRSGTRTRRTALFRWTRYLARILHEAFGCERRKHGIFGSILEGRTRMYCSTIRPRPLRSGLCGARRGLHVCLSALILEFARMVLMPEDPDLTSGCSAMSSWERHQGDSSGFPARNDDIGAGFGT